MVLSYAGQRLPAPPPGGISLELQPIDGEGSGRNANGDMLIEEVALKVKVVVKWKNLRQADASHILRALAANRAGAFRFPCPAGGGDRTIMAYYGAGAKVDYYRFDGALNGWLYSTLSASFIEI